MTSRAKRLSMRLSGKLMTNTVTQDEARSPTPLSPTSLASPRGVTSPRSVRTRDSFFDSHPELSLDKVTKTADEWKKVLPRPAYCCLVKRGMEAPFEGEFYNNPVRGGIYVCTACKNPLFDGPSIQQSDRGYAAFPLESIPLGTNTSVVQRGGLTKVEHACARCDGFLGYNCSIGVEVSSAGIEFHSMTLSEHSRFIKLVKQRAKLCKKVADLGELTLA